MNCSVHPERVAVGYCSECGQPLCNECYNYTNKHVCINCIENAYHHSSALLKRCLIFGIIFGAVFSLILGIVSSATGPAMGVGMGIYAFLGGFAFGKVLFYEKDNHKPAAQIGIMALVAFVLAPIFFILSLISLIRSAKEIKNLKKIIQDYPKV